MTLFETTFVETMSFRPNIPIKVLCELQKVTKQRLMLKVVQEYERAVIFRLGRLLSGGAKGPGGVVTLLMMLIVVVSEMLIF